MEIPDPKMLSRSEVRGWENILPPSYITNNFLSLRLQPPFFGTQLAAAIIDMHAAVSQKNVEIDHLKSEAKVLKRILEEKGEGVEWGAVDEGHGRGERKQTESKSVFFS